MGEASEETARNVAAERFAERLYPELRAMAGQIGSRFSVSETLRRTALVSEAFLRLRRSEGFTDERHFLHTAALAMRQILVNHARARMAARRGGGAGTVEFHDDLPVFWESDERLVALDAALSALAAVDPRLASVVECRFFGGYDEVETAAVLGVSDRTVRRDWIKARALLRAELEG
jgi:RNA polymerase sigma factor (TIGR02999 family)